MNIYFDMEFTGLRKHTTPISIGMITENGETFYAEFNDFEWFQCDCWIIENVINNLAYKDGCYYATVDNGIVNRIKDNLEMVSHELIKWLDFVSNGEEIQFVSDVCHYDMVLLIDIISNKGTAFDLPENISPVCHDINQDIVEYYGISDREAFNKSREEIIEELGVKMLYGNKHNSLYDAMVIKNIHAELLECRKVEKCKSSQ